MTPYQEEVNVALSNLIGHPRTVLDVGCGRGQNGEAARARGARVVGIEADPEAAAIARTRLDEVIDADVETDEARARLDGRRFDLVILGDVLEHTRRPDEVLARFASLLEDGGHVIVSLPNVAAWTVRLALLMGRFEYADTGILDETHLRFFTRKTALDLVRAAGLEVIEVAQNPMLVRAGLGAIKRGLKNGNGDGVGLRDHPLYASYLRYVRPVEAALSGLAPGALSFQTVIKARKPPVARALSLTVGMIAKNEAGAVGDVIDSIRAHAPGAEILIVDSSDDDTAAIARAHGARVLRQHPARGYGPAMHALLYSATTDVVVTMDCDGTYPSERILQLHRAIEAGHDLANGVRTRRRPQAMPLANFVANRVFAATTHVVHGLRTADVHSGMRAYRTSMLRALDIDPHGPALPVELLITPARLGYKVIEIDIPYVDRVGSSKLRPIASTLWTFRRIARTTSGARVRG